MKFEPDHLAGTNTVSRHERSAVWVNGACVGARACWCRGVARCCAGRRAASPAWRPQHFEQVLALAPELVIFGSGERLQFVSPGLYRCLIEAGIGVETMDTGAACRTYNVLASEGRSVVAALLLPPGA